MSEQPFFVNPDTPADLVPLQQLVVDVLNEEYAKCPAELRSEALHHVERLQREFSGSEISPAFVFACRMIATSAERFLAAKDTYAVNKNNTFWD